MTTTSKPADNLPAAPAEIPYQSLDKRGQLRRLRLAAVAALAEYELPSPRLAYAGWQTNLLYRVITADGGKLALRIAKPGWRTYADLWSEAAWLQALAHETVVSAPHVVLTKSDEPLAQVEVPGVPGQRLVSLHTWLPGRLLGKYLTGGNLSRMGELFAALHIHGKTWRPPTGFTTRRFDHWLGRGEAQVLLGGSQASGALSAGMRTLLEQTATKVEDAYRAVDPADLRVIHCDLWHDNIKLHRGVLQPFDFEDTVWGYRAHDIAMAMLDLLQVVGEESYPALLASFRRGYQAHLAWPDEPIVPFQVGRMLWVLNWFASQVPARLPSELARHERVFRHFLRAGTLALPER